MRKYIVYIILLCFSVNLAGQNLSVKGRWNIKASYAPYKEFHENYDPFFFIEGSKLFDDRRFARQPNLRIELNYGVLNWLETGVYLGFMMYRYLPWPTDFWFTPDKLKYAYAPTFGLNVNVHLLPFFVKKQKCIWDFYIPVRYGGCYLTKWMDYKYGFPDAQIGSWDDIDGPPSENKYRHEYGAGLGGGVYIKNIIGLYIELLGGQFSYWPEWLKSPYAIRFGITAKF